MMINLCSRSEVCPKALICATVINVKKIDGFNGD